MMNQKVFTFIKFSGIFPQIFCIRFRSTSRYNLKIILEKHIKIKIFSQCEALINFKIKIQTYNM